MSRILFVLGSLGAFAIVACTAQSSVDGDESAETAECAGGGTWAIEIATPVKWNASFVVSAGTGTIRNLALSTRTQDGLKVTDTARLCGLDIPDYTSTAAFGSEKYGIRWAGAAFEAPTMPKFSSTHTLSSKLPGATFTSTAIASILGTTLPNVFTDPWPSSVAALTPVDSDSDGKGGFTAVAANAPGFSLPPVNAARTARADRLYLALRQVSGPAAGTVKSCTRYEATADIAVIQNKAAIDSHVMGCHRSDGPECTSAEFKLLDGAAPVYAPTGKAVVTMIKVADTATCADVRAMSFQPGGADAGADGGPIRDASDGG
jgi:hypothetical protein